MIEDNFYTMNFVEQETIQDEYGSFKTILKVGVPFQGMAVTNSSIEQVIAALRGNLKVQYTVYANKEVPLIVGQLACMTFGAMGVEDPRIKDDRLFLRMTGNPEVNTNPNLTQRYWYTITAESYIPTQEVVG